MNEPKFILVVGTSAGGLNALIELVSQFRADMDMAVFIVMHLSRISISDFLYHRLKSHTSFTCEIPHTGSVIQSGFLYIAPPDHHLLIKKGTILLGDGPEENRWSPSIDLLFRSASSAYSSRVIGLVLTGSLDDGTTGMLAIKQSGGTCIVQDPKEAEYPDMPLSVLNKMEVDYCLPLSKMGDAIFFATQTEPTEIKVSQDVILDSEITEQIVVDYKNIKQLGKKSMFSCPDCGGSLWNINKQNGNANRYRCNIGHSYSEKDLGFSKWRYWNLPYGLNFA